MIIKKVATEEINKLWKNIQENTKTKMPKEIIDHGWHQGGLASQYFSTETNFIQEKLCEI